VESYTQVVGKFEVVRLIQRGVIVKIISFIASVALLFIACGSASADRQLDRADVLEIFQALTAQPRDTWIPAGTIEATHQELKAASGYTTDSTVTVRYDGNRFYWEINIDLQVSEADTAGNTSRHDFDLDRNKKRVFAWDGQRYTMYFRPGNDAIVTENLSDIPIAVNGPLTAGIVPWGYGMYTYEELLAAESSATEVVADGQKHIHLTLKKVDVPEIALVLDPEKDYAVLSCSIHTAHSSILKTYGDYQLAAGKWIPTTIMIERYDNSRQSNELVSYDYWELISIDASDPQSGSFSVAYEAGAFMEYYSSITNKPLSYHYSNEVDTELLLQSRLAIVSTRDTQTQNCATAAMKYVAGQLGKNVNDSHLTKLVDKPNKDTSLYELQQFARGLGFHCRAVKTDIQTLKDLKNCQAILHLPTAKHYVVLGHIDDEYVWLIDLDNDKFHHRTKLDKFGLDWGEGTALLISNKPLNLERTAAEISDEQLHKIIASDGAFGTYSCTDIIQEAGWIHCEPPIVFCNSVYHILYKQCTCKEDSNGGRCVGEPRIGSLRCICTDDPYNPGTCKGSGDWYPRYIRACTCE
jgi:hypothetical protein